MKLYNIVITSLSGTFYTLLYTFDDMNTSAASDQSLHWLPVTQQFVDTI